MVGFWIAAAALLLLPGALFSRLIPTFWERLGPGERLLPAFLTSAGWIGAVWGLSLPFAPTLRGAGALWAAGVLVLVALQPAVRRRTHRGAGDCAPFRRVSAEGGHGTTAFVFVLLALVTVVVFRDGGSLGYSQDSLDFVGFVRRMLETGGIDLVSAAYRDTTGMGPDPRRGAFHLGMALVCWASRTSPLEMWRWLPALLTPLSLWVFFATFRRVLSSGRSALFALFFLIASLLFAPDRFLHNLAYASRLGWAYSWVALWALALFLDIERTDRTPPPDWSDPLYPTERPGRPGRAAALLALAAPTILLAVHVLSAAQCGLAAGAFAWTWALARQEPKPIRSWLFRIPIGSLLLLLPFLALKILQSYSTANPIFDHPQGLLTLGRGMILLAPESFGRWFGWHGLLAMLLMLPLLRRAFESRAHAYLVASTLVAALVLWNPLATWAIEKAGAHSLLFRMLFVAPIYPVLGYYADWAFRRLREPIAPWRFALAVLYLAAAGGVLVLELRETIEFFRRPPAHLAAWSECEPLRNALEELSRIAPEPSVIVADPITSYQIPAYSPHYAIAPFHQHSSPADERAVERIHDVIAILNPYVPLERTVELLRRYRADYVLLNQSYPRYVRFFLASVTPETFPEDRAKFEARPELFPKVMEQDGVIVYRFVDPGPGFVAPASVNPYLALTPEAAGNRSAGELARLLGADPVEIAPVAGLEPIGVVFEAPEFEVGGYVRMLTYWRRTEPAGPLPVAPFYRLETAFPDARFQSPVYGKPYRLYYERRHGITYRFGRRIGPLQSRFPSFLWEVGAVYIDADEIPVPPHAAPGLYTISMKLMEVPFAANHELRDYLDLRDSLDGKPIGEVRIVEVQSDGGK